MFLNKLRNKIIGKTFVGIEHYTNKDEDLVALITVEKIKEELLITETDKRAYNEHFFNKLDNTIPAFIALNTNKIIQKEIGEINLSDEKTLYKTFPGLDYEEFYYQILKLNTKTLVAVVRKEYVDEIIEKYTQNKISIIGVSIGFCTLNNTLDYINSESIYTNNQVFEKSLVNDSFIVNENISNREYQMNGLSVSNQFLIAFSGVLNFVLKSKDYNGKLLKLNEKLEDTFFQKKFSKHFINIGAIFIFSILFFNFLIFNNYFNKVETLNNSQTNNVEVEDNIKSLQKKITQKEKVLNSLIQTNKNKKSVIINEIVKEIPSSILLNEFKYNILNQKIKSDEKVSIDPNIIQISGESNVYNDFKLWIEKIEKKKFIKNIIIKSYSNIDKNKSQFSIEIKLISDESK